MIVLVSVTLLWSAFAVNFAKSTLEVPSVMMRTIEPVQSWLVSRDIATVQPTNLEPEQNNSQSQNGKSPQLSRNKTILIQVMDKLLFALFLLLAIGLHN